MARIEACGARTLWQFVQGGTVLARSIPHTDERVDFEHPVSRLFYAVDH